MKQPTFVQLLFILSVGVPLSGCAMFEALGVMPRATEELLVHSGTPTSMVFSCIESSIQKLHMKQSIWDTKVTQKDEMAGLMETGYFSKANRAGFRVKAIYLREENIVKLELKGAGPYYADLGVDEGMKNLKAEVQLCI